jgi:enoyl-CoA hydratase/carnithine racemase
VTEVVPAGYELARALELADRICPLAVQATMENACVAGTHGWQAAYLQIAATQRRLYNSEDAKEGVQSFLEKREARFTGR